VSENKQRFSDGGEKEKKKLSTEKPVAVLQEPRVSVFCFWFREEDEHRRFITTCTAPPCPARSSIPSALPPNLHSICCEALRLLEGGETETETEVSRVRVRVRVRFLCGLKPETGGFRCFCPPLWLLGRRP
jgi:hypothetical protein